MAKKSFTKEELTEIAKKYTNRSAFKNGNLAAYSASQYRGLLPQVCAHMKRLIKPKGYWITNVDSIYLEAIKYNARTEFARKASAAYNSAKKLDIFEKYPEPLI